ncbi:1-acyl-sn-glycerol-3-phosphate acyltransferase [Apibacter adventoris]|uniref:1-acyl-sn-glycerol-3-phosphate acyltransferase n=1 Tax=Apibacter adventoris TaxID=1679466 RepID=UPI000CF6D542|nr:1-acyl-sn-glycerol-3-phosphate acyltransferase [Apibacter adventoris]PQL95149.1 glycerol acyltransferase [Apibacter adventoris]
MKKNLGKFMLWIAGWKLLSNFSIEDLKKSVIICAPHTSNWDFYYCLACFWSIGIPYKIMIKDNYTKPWYGFIFKSLGCIGVNRKQRNNLVEYTASLIKKSDSMALINTPEGTRSWAKEWKKGFYFIAKSAEVPVVLAYADYKNKIAGVKKIINIEGKTVEDVFKEIEDFYKPEMAKYPKNYNPKIY